MSASNANPGTQWTRSENKAFEIAIAIYDEQTPDRWQKVAALVPGKTVSDVIEHYRKLEADIADIEAGIIPVPDYPDNEKKYSQSHDSDQQTEKPTLVDPIDGKRVPYDCCGGGQNHDAVHSPASSQASNDAADDDSRGIN